MRTHEIRLGALRIRFHWGIALVVLLTAVALARLGLWQMSRAQEKIAEQEAFMASGASQATRIEDVPVAGRRFDVLQHQNRRVVMSGHYLNDRNIFLIYQRYEEQLGFEVLTPFRVADGGRVVLVSRGWSGITDEDALSAALPPIEGTREVEGQIFVPAEDPAEHPNASRNDDWPLLRRYVHVDELQSFFDTPLFPYVVRLAEGQAGVLVRHWPEVVVDTGRHYSYALQWFAMSLAVLTVALILSTNVRQLLTRRPSRGRDPGADHGNNNQQT